MRPPCGSTFDNTTTEIFSAGKCVNEVAKPRLRGRKVPAKPQKDTLCISHIYHEPIPHIGFDSAIVSLFDAGGRDYLDVGRDIMLRAEI